MLREGGIKPSITELLTLLEALKAGIAGTSVDDFYFLSRSCLVKDETLFDRFDQVFAAHFHGVEDAFRALVQDVPEDWLRKPRYIGVDALSTLLRAPVDARVRDGISDAL